MVWTWTHITVFTPSVWGVSACLHAAVWSWTHIMILTPSVWGVSACRHETIWTLTHIMVLTLSVWGVCLSSWDGLNMNSYYGPHTLSWGVSGCRHETVWTWIHIMVLTPSVWGVSGCRHETVWTWTHIMVLTPSPEVSPPIVIRRSKLGLISWSSHLLSEVSPPVVMRRSELGLISWSSHLLLRCLRLSSWDGLNLDSCHGPHTFQSMSQMYGTRWLLQKFRFSYGLQSKGKSTLVYFSLLAGWCLTLKPFVFPAKSTLEKFGLVSRLSYFCLWVIHGLNLWGSHVYMLFLKTLLMSFSCLLEK